MPDTLAASLVKLQADLPSVRKGRTAEIESRRTGKSHRYKYADLSDVSAAILPLLSKHGLAFIAKPTLSIDRFVLSYSLLHTSGEREDGEYPLPSSGTPQEVGSAISYARRYCLCAVTGVATEDDDGAAAEKASRQQSRLPRNADGSLSRSRTTDEQKNAAGVMTDAQHTEHTELQKGTARGRVPGAKRTSGPVPPEDDLWQDQPRNGSGRVGLIVQHFGRLGVTDRGVRLGYVAALTGHAVNSTNDLSEDEQKHLLDVLQKCRNQAALDQQSKQEVST